MTFMVIGLIVWLLLSIPVAVLLGTVGKARVHSHSEPNAPDKRRWMRVSF